MWIPDRGLAQVASWRLAAALTGRHPDLEVAWQEGPQGVEYDVLTVTGTGRQGPFHILLNRTGTVQCWLEDGSGSEPELQLGWDEVIRREQQDEGSDLTAAFTRIERSVFLVHEDPPRDSGIGFPVAVMAAVVAFHVGCGRAVRTHTEWVDAEDDADVGSRILARFPELVEDVVATQLGRERPADQVWVLTLDGVPTLAMHLASALAWVPDRRGPIDLHAVSGRAGSSGLGASATAAWLLGPMHDHDEVLLTEWPRSRTQEDERPAAAPQGQLGLGVIEAVDDPAERLVIVDGLLGFDGPAEELPDGPWVTELTPLDAPRRVLHSSIAPVAGPDAEDPRAGLRFHDGDRAYTFRALRDSDAAWISRFDIDLTVFDLKELIGVIGVLKDDLMLPDGGDWDELPDERAEAEELVAMVAEGGEIVFALHYLLLDGRRVINPQFREDGEWTDEIPYTTPLWRAEAGRVLEEGIATADPSNLMEGEDPANDPFMLMGVSDYLQIHPTMARAFMELFDRGRPVPAVVARLADGHADDLVRPGERALWESEPMRSWSTSRAGSSTSSEQLQRRTEPMRRIDLMRALYDISMELAADD